MCCTLQGFESRGTEISTRLTTWDNLLDSISHVGPLTTNPIQPVTQANTNTRRNRNRKKKKKKKKSRQERSVEEEAGKLGRWRRALSETAPLLTSEHRAAWLCGDPSMSTPPPSSLCSLHHISYISHKNFWNFGVQSKPRNFHWGTKSIKEHQAGKLFLTFPV